MVGNGISHTCSCFEGYELSSDQKSCTPLQVNTTSDNCKDGFSCGSGCLPWELTCDRVDHCPPYGDSVFPADEDPHFCGEFSTTPYISSSTCQRLSCNNNDILSASLQPPENVLQLNT